MISVACVLPPYPNTPVNVTRGDELLCATGVVTVILAN